jgi:adenylylsulfate kinase
VKARQVPPDPSASSTADGKGRRGFVVWLTGIPAAGKTTLGRLLETELGRRGWDVEVLDGDDVRRRLSPDLGFDRGDREAHNRRVIYLAGLLARHGVAVIVPLISPYRELREQARAEIPRFVEVWVKCSVEECIRRDPKGLYRKALAGQITDLTGLQAAYEEPIHPEVIVETDHEGPAESVQRVMDCLGSRDYLVPVAREGGFR